MPGPDSGPYHGAQYSSELPDELPLTHQQSLPTSDKLKINDLNGPMPEMWADASLSRHNSAASAHGGSPTLGRSSSLHRRMSGDRNALPQNSHELMRLNSADFEFIYPGLQVGASVREINTGMSGVIEDIIHSRKGSSAKVQMDGTGHLMQFFLRDLELNMDDGFAPYGSMREEDGVGQWQSASGRDDDHVARMPGMEWMNQQNVGPRIGQNELSRTTSGMPLDRKTGAAQVTGIPDNADIKHLLGAVSNAIGANRVNNKVWIANGTAILQFESVTYLNMLLGDERKREGTMEIKVGGQASNCKILRVDLKTQKVKFQARSMGLGWCQTPQKKAGCVVVDVTPDSQADRLGVKRGWIATYVEETALDSRGPIGIIEKHKKKDRDFHVTFQHIQQREPFSFNPDAQAFDFSMFNRPKDALDRTVSGKLQDDSVMYSPRASRQTSESGMSWANKVRGGSQDSHQRMMAGVAAGLNRDTGYGSRVQNGSGASRDRSSGRSGRGIPFTSRSGVRSGQRGHGSGYGESRSNRVALIAQTSGDGSGGSSKRKRRSGRRGKKNLDGPKPVYTCPQCATKCNGPQQLQQHIGSAGCKLRQLNLSRVECQPERSVFIGNIPLNCEEGDVLKSLTDRGVKVDTMQRADGDIPVIEMRMGKKCKYAVVQLVSAEERLNVVTIHHDEKITEKVMITGDVIQYEDDGKTPLYQEDGKTMVTKKGTVQLDIKPYRQRTRQDDEITPGKVTTTPGESPAGNLREGKVQA